MRTILQRVSEAKVTIDSEIVGSIKQGFVLLTAFTHDDNIDDLNYTVKKIKFMRLFDDNNGIMNIDIQDISGSILSISQFTLYADINSGRRPSYIQSMKFDQAKDLYQKFNEMLIAEGLKIEQGVFGADMKVALINDGPVTIIIDSKDGRNEGNKL